MLARIRALEIARGEIGVQERGGPNRGPRVDQYQEADSLPGVGYAWCAAFVQWCFKQAGRQLENGTASVGFLLSWAREKGWVVSRPFKGDLVCFQFTSDNWPDHVGFVERVLGLGPVLTLQTIEGNTSPTDAGSQDEGDGVYRKRRVVRASRVAFIRVPGAVDLYGLKVDGRSVLRDQLKLGPVNRRALNALRRARSIEITRR